MALVELGMWAYNQFTGGNNDNSNNPGSEPPYQYDQCDALYDSSLYLQRRDDPNIVLNDPVPQDLLVRIAGTPCKDRLKYDELVSEFCSKTENFTNNIGGGLTCEDVSEGDQNRREWCIEDTQRLKTDSRCSRTAFGDGYEDAANGYCADNPDDQWCECYNVLNDVCSSNPDAYGCSYTHNFLDANKNYFKDGYDVLKDNPQCNPNVCKFGYIPSNSKEPCKTYNFCGKDININKTYSDIIVDCNYDDGPAAFPDWWNDFSKIERIRKPPFDTFPLNLLPITRFPRKFVWKDRNVRYLTYLSSCSSSCLMIMIILILSLKR